MNSNTVGSGQASGQAKDKGWLDFYALLGVGTDADSTTLRKRIGEAYAEATANIDHRDINRRHYFQTMVERVLPQCRRVLLDPTLRTRYDEENARHAAGDASSLDYVAFMASLQGASVDSARQALVRPSEFESLPERVRDEINLARAVIEAVQVDSEYDLLPARAFSLSPSPPIAPEPAPLDPSSEEEGETHNLPAQERATPPAAPPAETGEYLMESGSSELRAASDTLPVDKGASTWAGGSGSKAGAPTERRPSLTPERLAQLRQDARDRRAPETSAQPSDAAATEPRAARRAVHEVPNNTEPQIRAKVISLDAQGKSIAQLREEAQARALSGDLSLGGWREPEKKAYRPRVSIGDEPVAPKKRGALLSPLVTHLATALISAGLIGVIFSLTSPTPAAPAVPVTIVYSSELQPVLESAQKSFAGSPEGKGVSVSLVPSDSRAAMVSILSPAQGASVPDAWIPSEAVWSTRFNDVGRAKGRSVSAGSGLALSPLVLVALTNRSQALKAQFPNRLIPSWSALRLAVTRHCVDHFGMTDPEKSGSGALVRTAMAREWCQQSRLPFAPATMSNKALWSWMNGFEENVPQYKMASDMVKDLALGTSAQYWWTLAYESDAIYWMARGKKLEVYYLPTTLYADHPFCRTGHRGTSPAIRDAISRFEKHLRSAPVQQAFLQSGFRAPEIDLSAKVQGNPFLSKEFAARGVRAQGIRAGNGLQDRDYPAVNALVAAWRDRPSA